MSKGSREVSMSERRSSGRLHWFSFFFQAEDGIRDLVRSRGLGDVYKRQVLAKAGTNAGANHRVIFNDQDAHRELRLIGTLPAVPMKIL